jgi:hypothetical protein
MYKTVSLRRRTFLKLAGGIALLPPTMDGRAESNKSIYLYIDASDPVATNEPVNHAVKQLRRACSERNVSVEVLTEVPASKQHGLVILATGPGGSKLKAFNAGKRATPLQLQESLRITPGKLFGGIAIEVAGADRLGLVYGLLELADRIHMSTEDSLGLQIDAVIEEAPANRVRSAARAFCSEIEDKPWYYDKSFWNGYLDMLVAHRFNRFNLAFGFGYDFPRGVTGDYFHFPYPYLVEVPGYDVTVKPLEPGEREKNFEAFRYIARATAARGLQFQLGIWTSAYAWTDSPNADHHIEGLNDQNHAAYSRDALAMLLKLCPEITGVTLRVHGESGIPEGNYQYWRTLYEAFKTAGRPIEIDMHAKGINDIMMQMAAETNNPVKIGAKWCAEHMGLSYHQADIRELEIPTPERMESGTFNVSNGARRFTRYGYADLYQEGAKYEVLYRMWPGTQRHLIWGDPALARGFGQTAHFCNAAGVEICEPLTFKGREGTGLGGGRCAYSEKKLEPVHDWIKFDWTYRIWGRFLYNPDASNDVWQRYTKKQFGAAGVAMGNALANASRVLPLVTQAHLPSASNHSYWPEIYADMPLVAGAVRSPYLDTPKPYCFATVGPIDPQMFSSPMQYAQELLGIAKTSAKTSPIAVATYLEGFTQAAEASLKEARAQSAHPTDVSFRRAEEDVFVQVGLGRFFAAKMRAAVAWSIFEQTGDRSAAKKSLELYQTARDIWAAMAKRATLTYVQDITYGTIPQRRGNWEKRLPGIDIDLAAAKKKIADITVQNRVDPTATAKAISAVTENPKPKMIEFHHTPSRSFKPGAPLTISISGLSAVGVTLFYRHVNQAERWQSIAMSKSARGFAAAIPGEYTQSPYPLQYYFAASIRDEFVSLPQWNSTMSNQPYYSVWKRES